MLARCLVPLAISGALQLAQLCPPSPSTRRAVAPCCCSAHHTESLMGSVIGASELLDIVEANANAAWRASVEGLARQEHASGQAAHCDEYNAAMKACREGGEWRCNILLLQRARRRGVAPLVDLYAQAIGACEDAYAVDESSKLYALGVQDNVFSHWHDKEPFSLDLHGFSQACATAAVRYVLQQELGNYLPSDLKIITGRGLHSHDGVGRLRERIETLLSEELDPPLPYERSAKLVCDQSGCDWVTNDGCLVVQVQHLFKWLVDSKPYETYYVSIPSGGAAGGLVAEAA